MWPKKDKAGAALYDERHWLLREYQMQARLKAQQWPDDTLTQVHGRLQNARDIIAADDYSHWNRNYWLDASPRYDGTFPFRGRLHVTVCAVGAIRLTIPASEINRLELRDVIVTGDRQDTAERFMDVVAGSVIGLPCLISFNDKRDRRPEDVVALFDLALAMLATEQQRRGGVAVRALQADRDLALSGD